MTFNGVRKQFRNDRTHQISRDGDEVIKRLAPLCFSKRHPHQNHISCLSIAEHVAPQKKRIRAEKAGYSNENVKDPFSFTHEKIGLILLLTVFQKNLSIFQMNH